MKRLLERAIGLPLRRPRAVVALLILAILLSIWGITRLRMDNTKEGFFLEGDPFVRAYYRYQEEFGSDEFVYLILDYGRERFFSDPVHIGDLKDISGRLSDIQYKGRNLTDEVLSLANVDYISGSAGTLDISPFLKTDGLQPSQLRDYETRAFSEPLYADSLISADGTKVGIVVNTVQIKNDAKFRKVITRAVRDVIADPRYRGVKITAVGMPILDASVDEISMQQEIIFLILSVVGNMLVLFLIYRSFSGVVAPMTVVLLGIVMVMGFMSLCGIPVSIISSMTPPLLIAVSIGTAVHLIHEVRRHSHLGREEAIRQGIRNKLRPCLFSTLTIMAGFLSLLTARVRPIRHLGLYSAFGVFAIFIVTFLLMPIFLRRTKLPIVATREESGRELAFLGWLGRLVTAKPGWVIAVSTGIMLIFSYFIPRMKVETNFVKIFHRSLAVRQDYEYVDRTMGGSNSIEVVIDTGRADGVKDPAFLEKVRVYQERLGRDPMIVKTLSLADIVCRINQVLNDNEAKFRAIPDRQDVLDEELFLYEISKDEAFDGYVDGGFRKLRVGVRSVNTSTEEFKALSGRMDRLAGEVFGDGCRVSATGVVPLFIKMAQYVTYSQMSSFFWAFVVIGVMMVAVSGSFVVGLISMYPNLLPVAIMFGVMGLTGIPLDFITVLACSIAIGVVDNTVHNIARAKEEMRGGLGALDAVRATVDSIGAAVTRSSITLCIGFLIMCFSRVTSIVYFGLLSAVNVFVALLADHFITPALLLMYYRRWERAVKGRAGCALQAD